MFAANYRAKNWIGEKNRKRERKRQFAEKKSREKVRRIQVRVEKEKWKEGQRRKRNCCSCGFFPPLNTLSSVGNSHFIFLQKKMRLSLNKTYNPFN